MLSGGNLMVRSWMTAFSFREHLRESIYCFILKQCTWREDVQIWVRNLLRMLFVKGSTQDIKIILSTSADEPILLSVRFRWLWACPKLDWTNKRTIGRNAISGFKSSHLALCNTTDSGCVAWVSMFCGDVTSTCHSSSNDGARAEVGFCYLCPPGVHKSSHWGSMVSPKQDCHLQESAPGS